MVAIDHQRDSFVAKLEKARGELETAGVIHKRDLQRQIKRMERELRVYDRFHEGGGGNSKKDAPEQPRKP